MSHVICFPKIEQVFLFEGTIRALRPWRQKHRSVFLLFCYKGRERRKRERGRKTLNSLSLPLPSHSLCDAILRFCFRDGFVETMAVQYRGAEWKCVEEKHVEKNEVVCMFTCSLSALPFVI